MISILNYESARFSGSNIALDIDWNSTLALTGLTASSWRTTAPLKAQKLLSSLYIITGTLSGCFHNARIHFHRSFVHRILI